MANLWPTRGPPTVNPWTTRAQSTQPMGNPREARGLRAGNTWATCVQPVDNPRNPWATHVQLVSNLWSTRDQCVGNQRITDGSHDEGNGYENASLRFEIRQLYSIPPWPIRGHSPATSGQPVSNAWSTCGQPVALPIEVMGNPWVAWVVYG